MNCRTISILLICFFILTACTSQVLNTPAPTTVPAGVGILPTSLGDFKYLSARLVDEANGTVPQTGEKILLVVIERVDGEQIDLAAFDTAIREVPEGVYIEGDDGSKTTHTMGGWVDKDFTIGFRVPESLKAYTLHWPGANPLSIEPE